MVYVDQNLVPVRLEMSRGPSFSIAIFIFIAIFEVLRKPLEIRLHIYIACALRALGLDKRNWLLAPNIQIFRSKLHICVPSGRWEPHQSMFSTRKRWVIGVIYGYQNFTITPLKNWFLTPKRPNLARNWHIWPDIGIIGLFDPMPDQKTMRTSCLGGFPLCGYQSF